MGHLPEEERPPPDGLLRHAQVRAAWDGLAAGFDRYLTPENTSVARTALRLLDVGPGTRLLDVAAGTGALSFPAAQMGAQVLATDLSRP